MKFLQVPRKRIHLATIFVLATLTATLAAVPIALAQDPYSFSFTNNGGNDVVNVVKVNPLTNYTLIENSTASTATTWNVIGTGGNDTFTLTGGNSSDVWVVTGSGNDSFNVASGSGNSTFSLATGSYSNFTISVNGNGTLRFDLTAGHNSLVNATTSGDNGLGDENWNILLGSNSTVLLPALAGNDSINVVF